MLTAVDRESQREILSHPEKGKGHALLWISPYIHFYSDLILHEFADKVNRILKIIFQN